MHCQIKNDEKTKINKMRKRRTIRKTRKIWKIKTKRKEKKLTLSFNFSVGKILSQNNSIFGDYIDPIQLEI